MPDDETNNDEDAKDRDAIEFLALAGSIWGDDQTLLDEVFQHNGQNFLSPVDALSQHNKDINNYLYTANAKRVFNMIRNRRMNKLNQGFDTIHYNDDSSLTPWWNTFANLLNNMDNSDGIQQNEVLNQMDGMPSIGKRPNQINLYNSNEEGTNKKKDTKDSSNNSQQTKEDNRSVNVHDDYHTKSKTKKSSEDPADIRLNSTMEVPNEDLSNPHTKASTAKRGKRGLSLMIGKNCKNMSIDRYISGSKKASSKR